MPTARKGLIALAISLATLVIIQLEIGSWRVSETDQSIQPLQLMVTSP